VLTNPSGLSPQPTRNPSGEAGPANSWWYDASTSVSLGAQPVSGYTFQYWKVDSVPQGNGINGIAVAMNAPHTAEAYYSGQQYYVLKVKTAPIAGITFTIN